MSRVKDLLSRAEKRRAARRGKKQTNTRLLVFRRKKRDKEGGIALIMVMAAIAVLTVMLAEFQDDTSAEAASAISERDGLQAEYMAKSAVNLARLLIAVEPTIRAVITPIFAFLKRAPPQIPVWDFSDRILGVFNDEDANEEFRKSLHVDLASGKNVGIKGGRFELVIVDEDAKINANLGASNDIAHIRLAKELMALIGQQQYNPLFEQKDAAGQYSDRLSTCAAIIDWSDMDESLFNCDITQTTTASAASGVEDAWYQLLPIKPYRRKNAPYDSLEEMHMVRGVNDDFWATFVDPDPTNPRKRAMTVWGQGAINVNTANAQTLLGVVCAGAPTAEICTDPLQSGIFLTGVTMAHGITMGAPLFGSPSDFTNMMTGKGQLGPVLAALGMKPVKFQSQSEFAKSITTESKVFSINAVGVKKGYRRQTRVAVTAVVDFRAAPSLSASATSTTPGAPAPTTSSTANLTLPNGQKLDPNGIAAALQPSTGGQIIYYRVE